MKRQTKNLIHNILYICVIALLITFSFNASKCHAATHLHLHLASIHGGGYYEFETGDYKNHNQNNFGIGGGFDFTNHFQFRAGGYENSHSKTSLYIGVLTHKRINRYVDIGLQIGAVSGYKNTVYDRKFNGTLQPMILPTGSLHFNKNVSFEFGYLPKISDRTVSLLTFTTGIKF